MPKKILFDARVLQEKNLSGVGTYARELLLSLLRSDQENDYVIFLNAHRQREIDHFFENIPELATTSFVNDIAHSSSLTAHRSTLITRFPNKLVTFSWNFSGFPGLKKRLRGIDLIFSPHISVFPDTGIPRLVVVHDLTFERFPQWLTPKARLWHRLNAHSAKKADGFITDSWATREDLIRIWRISPDRVSVITPPVKNLATDPPLTTSFANDVAQSSLLKALDSRLETDDYLLFVGTLEKRKNLVRLVRAFAELKKDAQFTHLKLVLAGSPGNDFKKIKRQIEKYEMQSEVSITGYVSEEQKAVLYRNAKLFVYPSLYEGYGIPLVEAQQFDLPIVAANVSSIPEVAGSNTCLIDPYDETLWSDILKKALITRKGNKDHTILTPKNFIPQLQTIYHAYATIKDNLAFKSIMR